MACLLLAPQAEKRGVVSFTTGERDDLILRYPDLVVAIRKLKSRYVVGLHHNWHDFDFRYNPLFDFHLAGSEDLIPVPGTPTPPLVPLDACNFVPGIFSPGGEKFWDVLFVARAVAFKGIPEFFRAIRALYDQGQRLRVLFLCPVPPTGDSGLRALYETLFHPNERHLFSFVTMPFDYPFPLDMPTLAHFYGASRVFVHSAPDERRCRVAAYAWATEMPVVGMACIGSILSPELRKPPYFFEIAEYADFPQAIIAALKASGQTPGAARTEVAAADTIITLRHRLEELFGAETLSPRPLSQQDLDIRMGRHHGLAFGKNRVEQDIGTFINQLQSRPDAELDRLRAQSDPEEELARLAPMAPRKVTMRLKDVENKIRASALFGKAAQRCSGAIVLRKLLDKLRSNNPRRRGRLVMDLHLRVGDFSLPQSQSFYLDKEELSRRYILGTNAPAGEGLRFLDVGSRDGQLTYLLGYDEPLHFNPALYERNKALFAAKYEYFGVDLVPAGAHVLAGDLCERTFLDSHPDFAGSFDIVYSNNVFEHLARPWVATGNLLQLLKPNGLCITIVPFAQRYHESPGDYFRYTPSGVISLFESAGSIRVLEAGFDIRARRYDWQGDGAANDIVPVDWLGAWRETWLTCVVIRKS